MSTVDEIKAAIEHLPPQEREEVLRWAGDRVEDGWDKQIEADVKAGRLDHILNKVRADIHAGDVREML